MQLLVRLQTSLPELFVRLWPQRFADKTTFDPESRDPNGFYLFGVVPVQASSPSSNNPNHDQTTDSEPKAKVKAKEKAAHISSTLLQALSLFENELRNDRVYEEEEAYVSVRYVKRAELGDVGSLVIDPFIWPEEFGEGNGEEDDEEDGDELLVGGSATAGMGSEAVSDVASVSGDGFDIISASMRKRAAKAKAQSSSSSSPHASSSTGKLRPATDVLNRLLWDPSTSSQKDNFLIGYEDRFVGIKECKLTEWKSHREVEDESFIPMHRVVYFRRISDGVVVWDKRKEKRVDLVFRSGGGDRSGESEA
jgi:uncharacterized protein (UPF0248 family)